VNSWCPSGDKGAVAADRIDPPGYGAVSTPDRAGRDTNRGITARRRPARLAVIVLLSIGASAACAGDQPGAGSAGGESAAAPGRPRVVAQPAADTPEAAFPVVEDLVIEATDLADQLFQDPTVVDGGDDDALLRRFSEIYTADSPTPQGVVAQLHTLSASGQRYRPGPSGRLRDVGVYRMTTIDGDQVAFRVCAVEDVEIVDTAGTVVGRRSQVTQGDGWAERSDGVWRFAGIDPDETATLPIAPGSAPSGFCDQLLGGP
jgi:hypothetical protein